MPTSNERQPSNPILWMALQGYNNKEKIDRFSKSKAFTSWLPVTINFDNSVDVAVAYKYRLVHDKTQYQFEGLLDITGSDLALPVASIPEPLWPTTTIRWIEQAQLDATIVAVNATLNDLGEVRYSLVTSMANGVEWIIKCMHDLSYVETGDHLVEVTIPQSLNGWYLYSIAATVSVCDPASDIEIRLQNESIAEFMTSSNMVISANEFTTYEGFSGTINTSFNQVSTGDRIWVDIPDGGGSLAQGLEVILTWSRTQIPE
jgi:hypothetical protein